MFVTVEFRNRSTIQLASLIDDAPSTAFLGTTHVQVCEILASGMAPESLFKVYVNTLSKKSRKARAISALANLIRASEDPVVSVSSDFIDERFQNLLGKRVELNCSKKEARNSLDKVEIFRFLGKALLHLLFRLFGSLSRLRKFDAVVRAWVDTTDRTYPEQIDSHVLLKKIA